MAQTMHPADAKRTSHQGGESLVTLGMGESSITTHERFIAWSEGKSEERLGNAAVKRDFRLLVTWKVACQWIPCSISDGNIV